MNKNFRQAWLIKMQGKRTKQILHLINQIIYYYYRNKRSLMKGHKEIISKTEIALQAIKKYEARNYRNYDKIKSLISNPHRVFRQIDDHYSRLHYHKELKLDKLVILQIQPYNQNYFQIDTKMLIFPIRIFVKNVRNQGVLYIGYDREFPGVQKDLDQEDLKIGDVTGRTNKSSIQQQDHNTKLNRKNYDLKFNFDKDMMFVLKNEKRKPIHKIYLTVLAKKQLLMLNLKFDYVGYQALLEQTPKLEKRKRAYTEGEYQINKSLLNTFNSTLFQRNAAELLNANQSNLIRSKTEISSESLLIKSPSLQRLQNELKQKNFIQANLKNIKVHKRQNSKQLIEQRKEKALKSLQRIKANRDQLDQFLEKQKIIKDEASKLKKAIQQYKKLYQQERVRDKKILTCLAPLFSLIIFCQKSNKVYNLQSKSIVNAFKVRYLIKKFTKQLRKKYFRSILQVANFKIRNQMSCLHILQLTTVSLSCESKKTAADVLFSAFKILEPGLIINHALNSSSNYRNFCRVVQRRWRLKFASRMQMLQGFTNNHVDHMLSQFPHLKLGLSTFKTGNHCYKICYNYITDESIKFRYIHDAYKKRVKQIQDFIETNKKIEQQNKGKAEEKKRKLLQIPKKPTPPQTRFFRNLDILKSMVRGWFQIQYKKIIKKNR